MWLRREFLSLKASLTPHEEEPKSKINKSYLPLIGITPLGTRGLV